VASVRLASMVGGGEALELIAQIASAKSGVLPELFRAQNAFEPDVFAERVFRVARFPVSVQVDDPALFKYLRLFDSVESVSLDTSQLSDLTALKDPPPMLSEAVIYRGERVSIRGIGHWSGIASLTIETIYMAPDLMPLTVLRNLQIIRLKVRRGLALGIDVEPLARLPLLREIEFDFEGFCRVDLAPLGGKLLTIRASQNVEFSGFTLLDNKSKLIVLV
jgi:hypothetical protein